MEVVIVENDSPHGILELSGASARVHEDANATDGRSKDFLFVLRKLGSFGDVTVGFIVISRTARAEEDYNVIVNQVMPSCNILLNCNLFRESNDAADT